MMRIEETVARLPASLPMMLKPRSSALIELNGADDNLRLALHPGLRPNHPDERGQWDGRHPYRERPFHHEPDCEPHSHHGQQPPKPQPALLPCEPEQTLCPLDGAQVVHVCRRFQ